MESQPFHCSIGNFPKIVELNPPVPCGSPHVLGQSLKKSQGKWWKGGKAVWQQSPCFKPQASATKCSAPAHTVIPSPHPNLAFLYSKTSQGRVIHELSPPRAPRDALPASGVCTGQTIVDYKIRNVQVERFFFFPPKLNYTQTSLY